ncbi:MAG TPA: hypothetical protein VKB80_15840 [Kofleriaceae bacterium]|nr:hypothetical protein [Kofleriaceae bacterium]
MGSLPHRRRSAARRPSGAILAALALAAACACGRSSGGDAEDAIDRAYGAYQAVAEALAGASDCASGIARAAAVARDRRPDIGAALAMQADPARMEAARAVLQAREPRYLAISSRLEAGFARCEGQPGLAALSDALDPPR